MILTLPYHVRPYTGYMTEGLIDHEGSHGFIPGRHKTELSPRESVIVKVSSVHTVRATIVHSLRYSTIPLVQPTFVRNYCDTNRQSHLETRTFATHYHSFHQELHL